MPDPLTGASVGLDPPPLYPIFRPACVYATAISFSSLAIAATTVLSSCLLSAVGVPSGESLNLSVKSARPSVMYLISDLNASSAALIVSGSPVA